MNVYGEYFYGNKISDYGLEHGYVDYATLAKAFDAVLNNEIMEKTWNIGYGWEQVSGFVDKSDEIEDLQWKIEDLQEKFDAIDASLDDLIVNYDVNDPTYSRIFKKDYEKKEELERKIKETQEEIEELENEQDEVPEVYQWYIVSDGGAEILKEINEIVYYHEELDMYLWGVTHWGTSWSYVLTDIRCNTGEF